MGDGDDGAAVGELDGVRVGQRDDEMFALTKDYRMDRVTLTIVADEVTKVDVG